MGGLPGYLNALYYNAFIEASGTDFLGESGASRLKPLLQEGGFVGCFDLLCGEGANAVERGLKQGCLRSGASMGSVSRPL